MSARLATTRLARAGALCSALFGALMLAPARAAADAVGCAAIAADADRLACYDRVHRIRPAPAQPAPGPGAAAEAAPRTLPVPLPRSDGALTRAWSAAGVEPFSLRPYRAIYVLPLSVTDEVNRRPATPAAGSDVGVDLPNRAEEVKFQLSAKTLLWPGVFGGRGDLWLAYTQSSRWQLYQGEISRPFRETNYEPELVFNVMTDAEAFGWTLRTAGFALNHQSNGRARPLSRSWNRLVGHVGLERGRWSVVVRPWLRLSESSAEDDNPDILDHVGRADLTLRRETAGGGAVSLRLRHTLKGGEASRGAAELDWSFPLVGRLHGHLQVSSGYGESLVDYNFRQNRIGLGFSLAGWN